MIGGTALNAATFIGRNYLACSLSGKGKAAQEEKVRDDKALEAYQAAYAKYMRDCTKLLDWIATNTQRTSEAEVHQHRLRIQIPQPNPPRQAMDFYQLSKQQKQGELIFVGTGVLALGYAAFCFL